MAGEREALAPLYERQHICSLHLRRLLLFRRYEKQQSGTEGPHSQHLQMIALASGSSFASCWLRGLGQVPFPSGLISLTIEQRIV